MKITVEFGPGLSGLVENDVKRVLVEIEGNSTRFDEFLNYLSKHFQEKRRDLFQTEDCYVLKHGILALINNCDWELKGSMEAVLEENDVVTFISTLHGG